MTQPFADALAWVPKSRALGATLSQAHDLARGRSHGTVTLEHLLQALIEDPDATPVLQACKIDLEKTSEDIAAFVKALPTSDEAMPTADPGLLRILEYAVAAAQQSKRREVTGAIVLAAIVGEGKSPAATLLQKRGLTFQETVRALQRTAQNPPAMHSSPEPSTAGPPDARLAPRPDASALATEDALTTARRRINAAKSGASLPPLPTPPPMRSSPPDLSPPPIASPKFESAPVATLADDSRPPPLEYRHSEPLEYGRDLSAGIQSSLANPGLPAPMPARPSLAQRMNPVTDAMPSRMLRSDHTSTGATASSDTLDVVNGDFGGRSPVQNGYAAHHGADGYPPSTGYSDRQPPAQYQHSPQARPDERLSAQFQYDMAVTTGAHGKTARSMAVERFDPHALLNGLPERLKVGRPVTIEVRLPRAALPSMVSASAPTPAAPLLYAAVSIRLSPLRSGMFLVPITPETQWLDNRSDPQIEDVARWRWTATASQRMRTQLQLSIVVRTMSADGSWIETVLPDQTVDVRIRAGLARSLGRWAGWLVPAVAGGVVTHLFGEALLAEAMSIITRFVGQS